jgi:hypothetical protein
MRNQVPNSCESLIARQTRERGALIVIFFSMRSVDVPGVVWAVAVMGGLSGKGNVGGRSV